MLRFNKYGVSAKMQLPGAKEDGSEFDRLIFYLSHMPMAEGIGQLQFRSLRKRLAVAIERSEADLGCQVQVW